MRRRRMRLRRKASVVKAAAMWFGLVGKDCDGGGEGCSCDEALSKEAATNA